MGFFRRLFGSGANIKLNDLDGSVLFQLKKAGSDLSRPHEIEFFLYFATESIANLAGEEIKSAGFIVEVRRAAQGAEWLCFAKKQMVPDLATLQEIRKNFSAIAVSKGGQYDGWGTQIVTV